MPYLTLTEPIRAKIKQLASDRRLLWIDTEVADYASKNPRLSLIQVLAEPQDITGENTYIFDVLDRPKLIDEFINSIMLDPAIEKVFHKASYDLKFLGKARDSQNVTCTWKMAKSLPYYLLPVSNFKLQTLAEFLCNFSNVDKAEQNSDWGKRPLTDKQLHYAQMDCVYLAQVHQQLLNLIQKSNPNPVTENLTKLSQSFTEVEHYFKLYESRINHLKERIQRAMQAQNLTEAENFSLTQQSRKTVKVSLKDLAKVVQDRGLDSEFPILLTKELQKELDRILDELPLQVDNSISWRLNYKSLRDEEEK